MLRKTALCRWLNSQERYSPDDPNPPKVPPGYPQMKRLSRGHVVLWATVPGTLTSIIVKGDRGTIRVYDGTSAEGDCLQQVEGLPGLPAYRLEVAKPFTRGLFIACTGDICCSPRFS